MYPICPNKNNKIKPIIIPDHITIIINTIKNTLLEYEQFINNIFPIDIQESIIITFNIYHNKNNYVAKLNALLNKLEVDLNNNQYLRDIYNTHRRLFKHKIKHIHKLFVNNINHLNNLDKLKITNSLTYSKSFLNLFKNNIYPPIYYDINLIDADYIIA